MRTLKFRAWIHVADDYNVYDDHEEKFPIHEMIYQKKDNIAAFFNEVCDYAEQDIVDIMQFIGLYDKGGMEIYEGDVVVIDGIHYKNISMINYGYNKPLVIDNTGFAFSSYFKEGYDQNKIKVIGNIYENPELL